VLSLREKEDIILQIEIENYVELCCAKTVTSLFNINSTVQEAIARIARRGNVFIEDIARYSLLKDGKILKTTESLANYNLKNKV
jgi:hypothetical protein